MIYQHLALHRANRLLSVALCQSCMNDQLPAVLPDLSVRILTHLPNRSKAAAILLAWCAARWCELPSIDLQAFGRRDSVKIHTAKGGPSRWVDISAALNVPSWQQVPLYTQAQYPGYRSVCLDLAFAMHRAGIAMGKSHHGATHVFRHITAKHMQSLDRPLIDITRALGHHNPSSTQVYLRSTLTVLDAYYDHKE